VSRKEKTDKKNLVVEGTLDAVKIGFGETYLSAFGIFLGGTPFQVGVLSTLPSLVGAVFQPLGMQLAERVASRRDFIAHLIRAQGLLWVPIACLPFMIGRGAGAVTLLLALVVLYQLTVGSLSPLWNSLVGDVIPPATRGAFFGYRNRWIAVASFIGVVSAGFCVHQGRIGGLEALAFTVIFIVAGVSRFISARYVARVSDPTLTVPEDSKFTFWQFIRRTRRSNFVKFVLFVSCMNFSASVSGPYFAMYMLRDLHLSYLEYTGIICMAVVAQFVVMRSWGSLTDHFGNRRILSLCAWFVAFNPLFWLISSNYLFILVAQFYSGFFWSGFNLAAANFVFDAVSPEKRARCIAYQGIINGVLVFLGALVGGALCTHINPYWGMELGVWTPPSVFAGVFLASGLLRLTTVITLLGRFKEVRPVVGIKGHQLLIRVVSIRPFWGATFSFVSGRYSAFSGSARRLMKRGYSDDGGT
jgi:MFS family permease